MIRLDVLAYKPQRHHVTLKDYLDRNIKAHEDKVLCHTKTGGSVYQNVQGTGHGSCNFGFNDRYAFYSVY